jgi:NAD+ kinase
MLALTPISPFRPRRWRGAILPDSAESVSACSIREKRPVSAVADQKEVRDVACVEHQASRATPS